MPSPTPSPSSSPQPQNTSADTLKEIDPDFLALLACPRCADRPPLRHAADELSLICDQCGRVYPITDGFPDLRLTEEEIAGRSSEV